MKKMLLVCLLGYTSFSIAQTPTLKLEFGTPDAPAPVVQSLPTPKPVVQVPTHPISAAPLAQPMGTNAPVFKQTTTAILYSAANDGNSSQARAWLIGNGIDFVEKSIEIDQNLKDLHIDGGNSVPFLKYGTQVESGFSVQTYQLLFFRSLTHVFT